MKLTETQVAALDDMLDRADRHDIGISVSKEKDGKYIRTPWELCEEIIENLENSIRPNNTKWVDPEFADLVPELVINKPLKGKKILVVDTVEFVPVLLSFGAEKCNITYVAPYKFKGQIASALGARVVQQSLLDWKPDMKFDVVVGNPPYNKGMLKGKRIKTPGGYPHLYFLEKCNNILNPGGCISFVIPTGLMTLQSLEDFRSTLLKNGNFTNITIYNNSKKKYFDIDKFDNVMSFVYVNNRDEASTLIRRENFKFQFNSVRVDLAEYTFWPMYFDTMSKKIFDKVLSKKVGRIPYLEGEKTDYYISFAVMGDSNTLTHTKNWLLNSFNPNISVLVRIFFSTPEEAARYYKFTKTPLYNLLLCMVKSTPKNQPQFVSYLGRFDFHDDDFYTYFNLTQEEIDYIEATVK